MLVYVLDINGVLADVRRRDNRLHASLVMSNGQRVYLRPGLRELVDYLLPLKTSGTAVFALWTSRTRENAAAIERLFSDATCGAFDRLVPRYMRFYGEDCSKPRPGTFKPVKSAMTMRRRLLQDDDEIVFIDDSPLSIEHDAMSRCLIVKTYEADKQTLLIDELRPILATGN